jgi:hypothetical protein
MSRIAGRNDCWGVEMNTLLFEKISRFGRTEPVEFGIPFAKAELADPSSFRLKDGDTIVPCQHTVTGTWPDGSVKWLFVRAVVDLPGNASKTMTFEMNPSMPVPEPRAKVILREDGDGSVGVETGPLRLTIPSRGIWPVKNVTLRGKQVWDDDPFRGLRMKFGEVDHDTSDISVNLTVEEDGPIRAVVRIDARTDRDREVPGVRARLTFWAGMPYFMFRYTVANRDERIGRVTPVRDWTLDLEPKGKSPVFRVAQGCYRESITRGEGHDGPIAFSFTAGFLKANSFEHQPDSFSHSSWADWECSRGGMLISLRHAAQNFPKAYVASRDRVSLELYPPVQKEPLEWFASTAKTHDVLFHFHEPDASDEELGARALQFHIPDVPILPIQRYARTEVWPQKIFDGPESRRIINFFCTMADNRPLGLGIFNFGDEYDPGYTNQGRGSDGSDEGDRLVWLNNEYDLTHHFYLFFARTGLRRFLDYAMNSARHWMDVDIIHDVSDPTLAGGHIAHVRRHASKPAVYPSHEWVQGLFDTYHFTGDPDAYEAALGVARNVAYRVGRDGSLTPGKTQTREMGWALRAMLNTWVETHEKEYYELGDRIVGLFKEWGRGSGELLAPYTTHSSVRVPFMNALTGVSLALWHLATGNEAAREIAVAVADDIIENATLPWGLPYYKELPSLKRGTAGLIAVELYSYAYRLTRDRKYLEAGLPALEEGLTLHGYHLGAKIKREMTNGLYLVSRPEPKGGKSFAMGLNAVLQFISVSGSEKLARGLDYRLEL